MTTRIMTDHPATGHRPMRPRPAARRRAAAAVLVLGVLLSPAWTTGATAQTPDEAPIRDLIARLDRGETEAVRQQLPEVVARYQNHPGVLFLQARVATDGVEAAKLYQSVLDNFPASEWADDALYHLYQYYYAMGLYKTAELKMQQLRKEYPTSEHLGPRPGAPAGTETAPPPVVFSPPRSADTASTAPGRETGERPAGDRPPGERPAERPADERPAADTAAGSPSTDRPPADRPIRESAPPIESGAPAPPALPYTLQTGAFSTSENAQRQKEWFEELGYSVEITNRVRSGRSLWLVWVGSYPDAETARKTLREIQSRYNITPIVVER